MKKIIVCFICVVACALIASIIYRVSVNSAETTPIMENITSVSLEFRVQSNSGDEYITKEITEHDDKNFLDSVYARLRE